MSARQTALAFVVLLVLGACRSVPEAAKETMAPIEPPARASFDPAAVAKGAYLAKIGDCITCHTAPGGKAYAGGRALKTPFGTIYGSNITPDPDTGIGRWSEAAFARALREGVDRNGRHLYPAFPYDHFRHVESDEIGALYAFLMTRQAVSARPPPNELRFPFNFRPLIAVWNRLFLDRNGVPNDPKQSPAWNRGAYLVAGLGHCGACHTPRNLLGAEKKDHALAGGVAEGWYAPALNHASPAPIAWTGDELFAYLRGITPAVHDIPGGSMAPVVHNLSDVPEQEVRAIATYVASLAGRATNGRPDAEQLVARSDHEATPAMSPASGNTPSTQASGTTIYAGACAGCHDYGRAFPEGALQLALSTAVALPTPRNLIQIIVHGIAPPDGQRGPWMPSFAGALTDAQLAELVGYLRTRFSDQPAWRDVEREVKDVKQHPDG